MTGTSDDTGDLRGAEAASAAFLTPPQPVRRSAGHRLRAYFLTGIVVAGPLAVTASVTWWFINLVDGWVKPLIPARYLPETYLQMTIPGFGLIVALVGLTMLGFLTANLVGRSLVDFGETLLGRMPVVRGLYKSVKQVFETVFSQSGTSFRTVGLVQFPAKGMWSIVFMSTPPGGEMAERLPGRTSTWPSSCHARRTRRPVLLLPPAPRRDRTVDHGRRGREAHHVGRAHPAEGQKKLAALAQEARSAA